MPPQKGPLRLTEINGNVEANSICIQSLHSRPRQLQLGDTTPAAGGASPRQQLPCQARQRRCCCAALQRPRKRLNKRVALRKTTLLHTSTCQDYRNRSRISHHQRLNPATTHWEKCRTFLRSARQPHWAALKYSLSGSLVGSRLPMCKTAPSCASSAPRPSATSCPPLASSSCPWSLTRHWLTTLTQRLLGQNASWSCRRSGSVERPESRSDPWRSGLRQAVPDPWRSGKSEGAQGWQQSSVVITCSDNSLQITNSFDIFCFITCSVSCSATLAPSQLHLKSPDVITCSDNSLHISNSFDIICFITCSVSCSPTLASSQLHPKSSVDITCSDNSVPISSSFYASVSRLY